MQDACGFWDRYAKGVWPIHLCGILSAQLWLQHCQTIVEQEERSKHQGFVALEWLVACVDSCMTRGFADLVCVKFLSVEY